jgi:uncharacterized protein DUF6010
MVFVYVVPVLIGLAFVAVMSLVRDPASRLRLNAVVAVGASGTYLSGGTFGAWELVACAAVFACAYRGLRSWNWVGLAWLLHTGLDVAHAVKGADLLPWAPHSSLGCALCDPVIALWCFTGGRPLDQLLRSGARRRPAGLEEPPVATAAAPTSAASGVER